jgi:hypothetical protein
MQTQVNRWPLVVVDLSTNDLVVRNGTGCWSQCLCSIGSLRVGRMKVGQTAVVRPFKSSGEVYRKHNIRPVVYGFQLRVMLAILLRVSQR